MAGFSDGIQRMLYATLVDALKEADELEARAIRQAIAWVVSDVIAPVTFYDGSNK